MQSEEKIQKHLCAKILSTYFPADLNDKIA